MLVAMPFQYDNGGRIDAGFKTAHVGDCLVRAIAIATDTPYRQVYNACAKLMAEHGWPRTGDFDYAIKAAKPGQPGQVTMASVQRILMASLGMVRRTDQYTTYRNYAEAYMEHGDGLYLTHSHACAVKDGVVRDIFDSQTVVARDGREWWSTVVEVWQYDESLPEFAFAVETHSRYDLPSDFVLPIKQEA